MTNLNELSGLELKQKIEDITNDYNTYKLTKKEASCLLKVIINEINNRVDKIATKYNKSPYFIKISHFI